MTMLRKATNRMAYGKVGLYGDAGSGKSRTAAEIAVGLCRRYGLGKPIGVFDTEPAWSFLLPLIRGAGLPDPYVYDESRAFTDLMNWAEEAKDACSVLVVDSVTHFWRDLQESCLARINDDRRRRNRAPVARLEFQHWASIKREWAKFTDLFLSSKVHFVVCGRAASVYEYQDKDDGSGKKELISVGTKMATEKEMGYEPSLLIEMVKDLEGGRIVNTAVVQKDRADVLNGHQIAFPDFAKLSAHFDALNVGGDHFESMHGRDSRGVFDDQGEDNFAAEMRRRDVALDDVKEEILRHHGLGQDAATKAAKAETLEKVAGSRSWERLSNRPLRDVQAVREALWQLTRGHEFRVDPVVVAAPHAGQAEVGAA